MCFGGLRSGGFEGDERGRPRLGSASGGTTVIEPVDSGAGAAETLRRDPNLDTRESDHAAHHTWANQTTEMKPTPRAFRLPPFELA